MRSSGRRVALTSWLTTERAAYGAVTVVALVVRLIGLAWRTLGPAEAAQALPAWAAAVGQAYDLTGTSPLLFGLQRLLFTPLGTTDVLARWWPALLGGLAPLLFYALRNRLTRGGALMAALLWAVSPVAVLTGRLGLGYGLVPPLALALMAALNWATMVAGDRAKPGDEARSGDQDRAGDRQDKAGDQRWSPLQVAAVALGLLLVAGSGAYTVVLIGLVAMVWWWDALPVFWDTLKAHRRSVALGVLVPLTLGATFFLMAPTGLAAAADLLGAWLRGLRPGAGDYGAWDIARRLLLSEPLLLGFGIAGLVRALRARERFGTFAAIAAGVALLVPLFGSGRHPADLGLVVLALTLLAGPAVAQALRNAWSWRDELDPWLLVGLSLTLLAAAALSLPSYFDPVNPADWHQLYASVGIVTTFLAVALWLIYGVWGDWRTVARALPVVPLVLGMVWGVSQLTGLNYDRGAWRQAAVLAETPAPGLADLQAELRDLAALHGGGAREARIDLVLPASSDDLYIAAGLAPMLRWTLRDFPNLRIVTNLPADSQADPQDAGSSGTGLAPLVITPVEDQPILSERYRGAEFTILQRWSPHSLEDFNSRLRWVLYREAKTPPAEVQSVVLWVEQTE